MKGLALFTFFIICTLTSLFAQDKPNVLFILIDDLRPAIGAYGDSYAITPNIDSLAKESIMYTNAFAQQAVCNPSRASMLTGLWPSTTGVYSNQVHFRENLPNVTTLPEAFKKMGYTTVGLGKVFHGKLTDDQSWSSGDVYRPNVSGWKLEENIKEFNEKGISVSNEFVDLQDSNYADAIVASKVVGLLAELKNQKFFIACGFVKPHLAFIAPKKYWDMYENLEVPISEFRKYPILSPKVAQSDWAELRNYVDIPKSGNLSAEKETELIRSYYAATTYIDAQVGRVIKALRDNGLYEKTIIILWGDHGFKLGEFGAWSKHTNYDIDTRVPLLIRVPGINPKIDTVLTESIDIMKTLVSIYDLEVNQILEGSDIINRNNSESPQYKYSMSFMERSNTIGTSLRTNKYRFTSWSKSQIELYDFDRYGERINVASDSEYRQVVSYFKNFIANKDYEKSKQCYADTIKLEFSELVVSPNPSQDSIQVTLYSTDSFEQLLKISIFSLDGKKESNISFEKGVISARLSINQLAPGTYLVLGKSSTGTRISTKFVVTD